MENPSDIFARNVRRLRKERGLTQGELAKMLPSHKNSISRIENGGQPGPEMVTKLAKFFGVDSGELFASAGLVDPRRYKYLSRISTNLVVIPWYNVSAAAGGGAAVAEDEAVLGGVPLDQGTIADTGAPLAELVAVRVAGDSMEPTLSDGDKVIVWYREDQAVDRDGIYVLRDDGELLVKRLQRLPGGALKVRSDNPAYPESFTILPGAEDVRVLGRVVLSIKKH